MFSYLVIYIVVFLISLGMNRLMIFVGPSLGLMDRPGGRRVHKKAVPRAGGIAIWISFVVAVWLGDWLELIDCAAVSAYFFPFLAASSVLLVVGIMDDRGGIRAWMKLGGQVLAAGVFYWVSAVHKGHVAGGSIVGMEVPLWADCLIWIAWIVLLVNAYNLIDGLDGLCGGLAWISLGGIILAGIALEAALSIGLVVVMGGAIMGFLVYNRHPARLFLGDAGSMMLGLFVATVATELVGRRAVGAVVLLPLAVAGVPLFDVLLAVWRRSIKKVLARLSGKKNGAGLFVADKEHLHHRLLARGWNQRKVSKVLQLGAAVMALACILPIIMGAQGWALFAIVAFVFAIFVGRQVTSVELIQSGNAIHFSMKSPGELKRRKVGYMLFDALVIPLAWVAAYVIEKTTLPAGVEESVLIPYMGVQIIAGIGAMHMVSSYQKIWRRSQILDYAMVAGGLFIASMLVGILASASGAVSSWVLMGMAIDGALLTTMVVLFPRASSSVIAQLAVESVHPHPRGKRILVYGAGDMGALYLDYLATRPRSDDFAELVGFVDDHPGGVGRKVRGFSILGSGEDLPRLIAERQINQVIVTIDEGNVPEDFFMRLRKAAEGVEVELKRWSCGLLPSLEDGGGLEKSGDSDPGVDSPTGDLGEEAEGISEGDRGGDRS